eukprot:TRINITY_DN75197_c0_g1_i1.p1 TRINITY_DN75197_c0_g1~~TRINITY_DN75197_c0_g1_i1.p1  ORF type:complete len:565 (+),score=37.95 TRINITY_DN75197_c0_g1_i1:357-2051(+)
MQQQAFDYAEASQQVFAADPSSEHAVLPAQQPSFLEAPTTTVLATCHTQSEPGGVAHSKCTDFSSSHRPTAAMALYNPKHLLEHDHPSRPGSTHARAASSPPAYQYLDRPRPDHALYHNFALLHALRSSSTPLPLASLFPLDFDDHPDDESTMCQPDSTTSYNPKPTELSIEQHQSAFGAAPNVMSQDMQQRQQDTASICDSLHSQAVALATTALSPQGVSSEIAAWLHGLPTNLLVKFAVTSDDAPHNLPQALFGACIQAEALVSEESDPHSPTLAPTFHVAGSQSESLTDTDSEYITVAFALIESLCRHAPACKEAWTKTCKEVFPARRRRHGQDEHLTTHGETGSDPSMSQHVLGRPHAYAIGVGLGMHRAVACNYRLGTARGTGLQRVWGSNQTGSKSSTTSKGQALTRRSSEPAFGLGKGKLVQAADALSTLRSASGAGVCRTRRSTKMVPRASKSQVYLQKHGGLAPPWNEATDGTTPEKGQGKGLGLCSRLHQEPRQTPVSTQAQRPVSLSRQHWDGRLGERPHQRNIHRDLSKQRKGRGCKQERTSTSSFHRAAQP